MDQIGIPKDKHGHHDEICKLIDASGTPIGIAKDKHGHHDGR